MVDFIVKNGLVVGTDASISGRITSVDAIHFDRSLAANGQPGALSWNVSDATLDLGLSSNVTLQLGQEQHYYVTNQSGSTITNGSVVMAVGTLGASGRLLVAPAVANGSHHSKHIIGIATDNIGNGETGYVASFGKIRGLNTSMFSEGDILYASPSIPGALSNTAPIAPNNFVTVAMVVSKHATNGTIFVRPTYSGNLLDNEVVYAPNLLDGQTLAWSSANARFENKTTAQNSFSTIAISGQSNLVADSPADTLTVIAGNGVDITTNTATNSITISSNNNNGITTGKAIAMAMIFGG